MVNQTGQGTVLSSGITRCNRRVRLCVCRSLNPCVCACVSEHSYLLSAVRRLKSRIPMPLHAGVLARCRGVLLSRRPAVRECLRHIACTVRNQERHCFVAPEESATKHLAALLAQNLRAGDCYCLHGDVGAGKSVFR